MSRAVHGQNTCITPKAERVIARYLLHPIASIIAHDARALPASHVMALALWDWG
jgi:hypothetical protein